MPQEKRSLPNIPSTIQRYGLAVVSVALALLPALLLQHYNFHNGELSLLLFAVAFTAWYAGVGPAALSIVLSTLCFTYFFAPPIHSFAFTRADVPAIVMLVSFAVLITRFSAVRRRIEGQLLRSRDELQTDVAERNQTEEKLRRSETYLAEAQRLTKTGSLAWDPDNAKTLHCSDEVFRMFGLDPQKGMPAIAELLERVHPEDREYVTGRSRRGTDDKGEPVVDYRVLLPDGVMKYIHSIRHPVLNDSGEVVEFMGTLIDVTEQKRAEEALRRSEAYLAEAQRLSKTGSWAWDPRTDRMLYCSEELCRMFDIGPAEGMPSIELFRQRVHPEDHDRVTADGVRTSDDKTAHTLEYKLLLPDGTIKHVESKERVIFDGAGDLIEVIGTVIDVTERKRAEEALREREAKIQRLVDADIIGIFIWDFDGRIFEANDAFLHIVGYERQDVTEGRLRWTDITPLEWREQDARFSQVHKKNGRLGPFEKEYFRKDGSRVPVMIGSAVFDKDSSQGVAFVLDLSERKRAEAEIERLHQLEADISQINRVSMMGELAASLAHEIKQPIAAALTNAKTSLRWLQRDPPDIAEAREAISRIVKDANRAAEIIDRNRALYRRGTPPREALNLHELIREMVALLHDTANRHSISIRAELDAVPVIIADRVQLQQVLMNLMLNGIEAMKDTGGELTIHSKKSEDGQVLLSVSDVGIGLPIDNAERIFDAFFTTKKQGTGMGLSISRRIIESHAGRLWASANPGRGATFHFTLPTGSSTPSASGGDI